MKKIAGIFIFLFLAVSSYCQMVIEVNGSVTFNSPSYIITEAGNDFPSSINNESSVYVSIVYSNFWDKYFNPNKKWKVDIQKSDLIWNQDLKLEAMRTGDGYRSNYGKSSISDGTTYQTVTNTSNLFFKGRNEITYIPLNFKLSGVSITMGAQDFETNIILTVYDD